MSLNAGGRRGRVFLAAAAAVLAALGVALLVVGVRAQRHAPQPPPAAAGSYALGANPSPAPAPATPGSGSSSAPAAGSTAAAAHPPATSTAATPQAAGPVLPRSRPVRLDIPALGVHARLSVLGLNADGTVQVPPLSKDSPPGWYRYSPTPGQVGPSIILGHIDSAKYGPAVFFRLGALRKGDRVLVTGADHRVAVFRIDAVASYPKNAFPTLTVYGNTDHAALRLITCGGKFDSATRNYESNTVVFASLVTSHPARG